MNIGENVFVCRIDVNYCRLVETITTLPYSPEKFDSLIVTPTILGFNYVI